MTAVPAGSTAAGSVRRVAFGPVCAATGGVAPAAPGSLQAGAGAFHTPPTLTVKTASIGCWGSFREATSRWPSQGKKYLLCKSRCRQRVSSRQSFGRSTPGSSSSHNCRFYRDSHSDLPKNIYHLKKNHHKKLGNNGKMSYNGVFGPTVKPGAQWHRPVAPSHTPPLTHRQGSRQPWP